MIFRKSLSIGIGVGVTLLGGIAVPTMASAEAGLYLNIAPPESRYEAVPLT